MHWAALAPSLTSVELFCLGKNSVHVHSKCYQTEVHKCGLIVYEHDKCGSIVYIHHTFGVIMYVHYKFWTYRVRTRYHMRTRYNVRTQ